jgi:hypothetical protein
MAGKRERVANIDLLMFVGPRMFSEHIVCTTIKTRDRRVIPKERDEVLLCADYFVRPL